MDSAVDFLASVGGKVSSVEDEGGDDGGGTFRVTVFYHDTTKDFGRVDPFHPIPRSNKFVSAESAVRVLD